MFCESCGAKLKETAKFCSGCGTKVEITESAPVSQVLDSIPLVALPEGVTGVTVPVEILEVRAEGPDSDNNLSITVKCRCNNETSDDWHLLKVRTQLLNGIGEVIDEANDTYEELIAGQSQYEFEPSFWGINASLLGTEPEKAHVVVFLTASRKFSFDLGKVSVPEVAFSTVEIPAKGMSAMQMVSCSLWKGLPDEDKDSRIEVRSMLQNLTAERLPLVKIMAVVSDKQGEELTTIDGEDELRAGELLVLNTSSYAKDKKLKGATTALSMDMYWLTASGITQRQGMELSENNNLTTEDDDENEGRNEGGGLSRVNIRLVEFIKTGNAPNEDVGDWDDQFGVANYFIGISLKIYDDRLYEFNEKIYHFESDMSDLYGDIEMVASELIEMNGDKLPGDFLFGLIQTAISGENDVEVVYDFLEDVDVEVLEGVDDIEARFCKRIGCRVWSLDVENASLTIEEGSVSVDMTETDCEDYQEYFQNHEDDIQKRISIVNQEL